MLKIDDELDIRVITKELRTLRFVANVILTKYQRFMIPQGKNKLINQKVPDKTDQDISMREVISKTIQESCTSKMDLRILKSINAGTDEVT